MLLKLLAYFLNGENSSWSFRAVHEQAYTPEQTQHAQLLHTDTSDKLFTASSPYLNTQTRAKNKDQCLKLKDIVLNGSPYRLLLFSFGIIH